MFTFFIICLLIFIIFLLLHYKVLVDIFSFFRRGKRVSRGPYGIYDFDGPQGCGKTSSLVNFLLFKSKKKKIIFSNISSLVIPTSDIIYFEGFDGLKMIISAIDAGIYQNKGQIYIVYDELLSALSQNDKIDKSLNAIFAQLRKRKIIMLTTSQFWTSIPKGLRELCRYRIRCKIFLHRFSINIYEDAEKLHYVPEIDEYEAPYVKTDFYKISKLSLTCYDTRERIISS